MKYEEKKAKGLCVLCSKPREDLSVVKCSECKEKEKQQGIRRRATRKEKGICRDCGEAKEDESKASCSQCLKKRIVDEQNRQVVLVEKKLCSDCTKPLLEGEFKSCFECRIKDRKNRLFIKIETFEHYGKKCGCCGQDIFWFLTIDHLLNNGKEHRKQAGGGNNVYYDLRKHEFPNGFGASCFNCNIARYHNKNICPHIKIFKEYSKSYLKEKISVLKAYGMTCKCCDETNIRFLSIDHIHANGAQERREKLDSKGRDFYRHKIPYFT